MAVRKVTQTILSARGGAVPLQSQHSGTETGALGPPCQSQPELQHKTVSELQNRPTKACSQLEPGSHPIIEVLETYKVSLASRPGLG